MDNHISYGKRERYKELLKDYMGSHGEKKPLWIKQNDSEFIQQKIFPEEIIRLHDWALRELYPGQYPECRISMDFLLEVMTHYGLSLKDFEEVLRQRLNLESEISVAAKMQKIFWATEKPNVAGLDIGAISVPAGQMNGDYYRFSEGDDGSFSVSIADAVGKGIPAAFCVSMIKYGMDNLSDDLLMPEEILEKINKIIEREVEPSVFVTMLHGKFEPEKSVFKYATAGHEPGFHYDATKDEFYEIQAKGLVLGVLPDTKYAGCKLQLMPGDMIILLTDGVTECREDDEFIGIGEVLTQIRKNIDLPAQQIVEEVHQYFEHLQDRQLRDDFTLIIIRKES